MLQQISSTVEAFVALGANEGFFFHFIEQFSKIFFGYFRMKSFHVPEKTKAQKGRNLVKWAKFNLDNYHSKIISTLWFQSLFSNFSSIL